MKTSRFSYRVHKGGSLALFSLVFVSQVVFGAILPNDRLITWNPGVPGGIPIRTNIYTTLAAGTAESSIQTALNSCPSNGVVMLSAGTYTINSELVVPSYKTLRGQGTNTVLNLTGGGGGSGVVLGSPHGGGSMSAVPPSTGVSSGYSKGSTSIVVASSSGINVGDMLIITEKNEPFVSVANAENGGQAGDQFGDNSSDLMGQIVMVTSKSGTTLGVNPPLYWDYKSSLSPLAYILGSPYSRYAGVENLKVYANNTGLRANIQVDQAAYCWVKNVESDFADGDHVWIAYSLGIEVRDSFFHDGFSHGPGTTDDAVKINWKCTACLVENNVLWRMHGSVMVNDGAAGNVIAYNFATNAYHQDGHTLIPDQTSHGAHPMFNLYEGNIGSEFKLDSSHGTSSHSVALRNWFCGQNYYAPPMDARGTIQWGSGSWETGYSDCFAINWSSSSNSLIGNIAGCAKFASDGGVYQAVATGSYPGSACFTFGYMYDNSGYSLAIPGFSNLLPWQSGIQHGNYDYVTRSQHWDSTISDHTIPNSYYLSSKPAWFGPLTWPPIDPANPSAASMLNIPAGYRYVYGTNPPSGSVNQAPVAVAGASTNSGRAPLLVTFSSTGSYDPEGTALSYNWTFGDSGTSTAVNPSHTYASAGSYSARLAVSDGTNTTTSSILTITVTAAGSNYPPVAAASATPSAGIVPLSVSFSSAGSSDPEGTALTYRWTFGDGSISTAANPAHSYTTSGVYSAQLQVSDGTNNVLSSVLVTTVGNGATGLVAAYGFEEGSGAVAGDVSGNGNAGSVSGGTWTTGGRFGNALTFGSGTLVTVNDAASLHLTSGMTLEAWVYPTSLNGSWMNLIVKPNGDPASSALCYVLQGCTPSGSSPSVTTSLSSSNLLAPASLALNTWSHIAATYDGATLRLYVNGALVGTESQSGAMAASTDALTIGGNTYSGQNWAGLIDEVRIYNRALSATELQTDMNAPVIGTAYTPPPPQGLRVLTP